MRDKLNYLKHTGSSEKHVSPSWYIDVEDSEQYVPVFSQCLDSLFVLHSL